jgi:hypothetical protein
MKIVVVECRTRKSRMNSVVEIGNELRNPVAGGHLRDRKTQPGCTSPEPYASASCGEFFKKSPFEQPKSAAVLDRFHSLGICEKHRRTGHAHQTMPVGPWRLAYRSSDRTYDLENLRAIAAVEQRFPPHAHCWTVLTPVGVGVDDLAR